MSTGWLKGFSKRSWRKQLAVAVTAGILAGAYAPGVMAADYTTGITGSVAADQATFGQDAVTQNPDGTISYKFTGNNFINVEGKTAAHGVVLGENNKTKTIDLNGGTLKIYAHSTSGPKENSTAGGISLQDGGQNLTIKGNLDIQAHSNSCFAHGIGVTVAGTGTGAETHLTIDGNVKMRSDDVNNPWGVTAKNMYGGYGPGGSASSSAPNYTGARWAPSGIVLGTGHGSTITVNGDVDMAIKGNAIVTNNYNQGASQGTIKLNGKNITIETPESTENTFYALAGFGGDIYVGSSADSIVNIKGNIIAMSNASGKGNPYYFQDSKIQLALMNSESNWTGVIDNSGKSQAGEVNLYLQNGATWNHQSMSKTNGLQVENMPSDSNQKYGKYNNTSYVAQLAGGKTADSAGYIYQKDKAKIDVKEYAGHTVVHYEHQNSGTNTSDYKGGDFVIHGASQGSGITLSTDYNGITASDKDQVAQVLNALAGKLYYKNFVTGERNLEGKVQIASGLTASEASKIVGNIVFDKQTGQGTNVDGGDTGSNSGFTTAITGIAANDAEYNDLGVIQNGNYIFDGNTDINITGEKHAAAIDLASNIPGFIFNVNTAGDLNLNVAAAGNGDRFGIRNANGKDNRIEANALNIKVDSNGAATGISYTGPGSHGLPADNTLTSGGQNIDVKINANGKTGAKGIHLANGNNLIVQGSVDINANGTSTDSFKIVGIHVDGGLDKISNTLSINENVNINTNGTGILVEGNKSTVNLRKGVTINTDKANSGNNYALATKGGKINVNGERYNEGNVVAINGNIGLLGQGGSISMNLLNKDSKLNGVIYKAEGSTDAMNLKLSDGAVWTNESYGNEPAGFKGSYVDDFYGGPRREKAGIILQKDSRDLTINSFGGVGLIVYDHTGDGTKSEHYTAGNTIINHAKDGGNVIMTTDSKNIDMQDTLAVDKVLNALAGKLYYKGFVDGETDLHGQVQIASGLTSSIVSQRIETIKFNPATGQGSYGSNQLDVDFKSGITGNTDKDKIYADAGVLKDGKYIFEKASTITVADAPAINAESNIDIYATKAPLNMAVSGNSKNPLQGITVKDKNFKFNGKELNLKVENIGGRAEGIYVAGNNADNAAVAEITGNVKIDTGNSKDAVGIHTSGNSQLTINGDLTVNAPAGTVDNRYGYYSNGAIYAGGNRAIKKGSTITVNGNVNINNNGVFANGFGSTVNINGGGNISIDKNNNKTSFAIGAQSGTVNVNMNTNKDGAADNKLNINGNIGLSAGLIQQGETAKNSVVNIGLSTSDSTLHGIVANNIEEGNAQGFVGEANIYLQNGATWTNEAYGKLPNGWVEGSTVNKLVGGSDAAHAGVIIQKDANDINVKNYSGHNIVIYEHTGNGTQSTDYKAGNFIVDKAAQGSSITMSTDNKGINMRDSNEVTQVLNALAGKLTYKDFVAGKTDLVGKVQIAGGLTGSSAAIRVKDITFDKETGKGTYVKPGDDEVTNYTTQIIEDNYIGISEKEYWNGQYVRDDNKNYTFDTNAVISINGNTKPAGHQHGYGVIQWAGHGDGVIDMTGHKLTLNATNVNPEKRRPANGIIVESENLNIKNVNGLDININNSERSKGIYVVGMPSQGQWDNGKGNAHLTIENDDDMKNAVKIRFNNCIDVHSGIYVYGNSGTAKLDILGNVDIEVGNGGDAIRVERGDAYIGGGKITAFDADRDALYVRSGNLLVNAELGEDGVISAAKGNRDVIINGDIAVETDKQSSQVSVALNTANSVFKGGIKHVDAGGKANLLLANKALWENGSKDSKFTGSVVDQFVGGSNKDNAGYIKQNDTNNLVFNSYSGNAVIMYEHTGNGTEASHYAGGDTIIKNAKANSGIVLSTQSNGINMQDNDEVSKVLNTLAGKLTYEAFKTGEDNLNGKVQIAEGLTSSSASLTTGRIEFNKDTGKGSYVKETKLTFTAPITGNELPGSAYITENVWKGNGNYEFAKGSEITVNGTADQAAVDIKEGVENTTIKAEKGVLNFNAEGESWGYVTVIKDHRGGTLNIEAEEINVSANNTQLGGGAKGIFIQGASRTENSVLNLKGNVNVNVGVASNGAGAYGIHAEENAVITIDGNLTMKDKNGSWGVTSGGENFDKYAGLYVSQATNTGKPQTGTINVNGNVDLAVDGIALLADGQGGKINIKGGNILVNKNASKLNYAAVAKNGSTINMNMAAEGNAAGTEALKVSGNIGLLKKSYETAYDTAINIGLSGKNSELNGVIFNEFLLDKDAVDQAKGQVNMYLSNDAVWNNQSFGKLDSKFNGSTVTNFIGGTDSDRAGIILQNDNNKLTFENYSGYGAVIYKHNGNGTNTSDYIGGDTIIKNAASGAGIILATDNSGITLSDKNMVNSVLNALAGKLTYEGFVQGENNLYGEARIASGLTGSSVSLSPNDIKGEITFDKETGKGSYEAPPVIEVPDHQVEVNFATAITGNEEKDTEYLYGGVIKTDEAGNNKYVFTKDSNINIKSETGTPGIDVKKDVVIDATGSTLNFDVAGDMGIKQESNKQLSIKADRLNIKVNNDARAEGLHVASANTNATTKAEINGNVNINVSGIGYALGIYAAGNSVLDINGNVTMKGEGENKWGVTSNGVNSTGYYSTSGIYAGTNPLINKGSTINIKGDVDLAIDGSGIVANGADSAVNVDGGGNIVVNDASKDVHYALIATSGTVNMNVNKGKTGAANHDVNIKGNIGVTDGAAHDNEPAKKSEINLGLNTNQSQLHGVIVHDFKQDNLDKGFTGKVNLYMGNYAVWVNEAYGKTIEGFNGSFVDNFVGGKDESHAAIIKQFDSNKLTLDNYSGHAVVVYKHEGDGTSTAQYTAGDTVINHASKGSGILLTTDNKDIDYNNAEQVDKVLNALAGKLTYTDAANNESNLSGRVQIASGLTGSEVGKWVGDIDYGEGGKGGLAANTTRPGKPSEKPDNEVTWGDYENEIMRGVRSAMTGTMMTWRDNAADMFGRTSALRNGEEKGAWVRTTGGKHKYTGANTELGINYWGVQFGYDRALKNGWNIGGVVDYRDGNTSFNMGGDGDNKVYSFGVYGSRDLGDNSYIDLTAKAGRAENDFTAYNEIGTKVEGEYNSRGYSFSAQYGKRFTSENGSYFEPQLQLTYAHLDGAKYTAISHLGTLDINQSAYNSFVGRIGLEAGKETEKGYYYARLGLAHEFAGDIDATYYAKDGGFKQTNFDMGDTWSELTLGANYQISKSSYFYADVTRGLSGDYRHEWKVNGGLSFTF